MKDFDEQWRPDGRCIVTEGNMVTGTGQQHTPAGGEIPWFPARTPKLLSRRVCSALLVLDASAPSEPGGGGGVAGVFGLKVSRGISQEGKVKKGSRKQKWLLCKLQKKQ